MRASSGLSIPQAASPLKPPVFPGHSDAAKLHEWRVQWGTFWGERAKETGAMIRRMEGK